ncbi:Proline-rich protein PRCC [Gracilaria domingensis]|nr:Proline-rich protein PRCC [Gracilaria domingensis]
MLHSYDSDSSEGSETRENQRDVSNISEHEHSSKAPAVLDKQGRVHVQRGSASEENDTEGPSKTEKTDTANSDIPAELAAELRRAGHDLADVNFIDINATANARLANSNDHIPASALRNTATRLAQQISKSRNVGRVARRKHQITALAADALALQAAQAVLPGSASRRKR